MKNKTFHYTNEQMAKDLIAITPFKRGYIILDAGSGLNKVWYKNILKIFFKNECEYGDTRTKKKNS